MWIGGVRVIILNDDNKMLILRQRREKHSKSERNAEGVYINQGGNLYEIR